MSDSDSSSVTSSSTGSSRSSTSGSSTSGSSRSSSSKSTSSKSSSSKSSRGSKSELKRPKNRKDESSGSSSSSSSDAELVTPRKKTVKEETDDDEVEFATPRKTVKESSSEVDSGIEFKRGPKTVALESDFSPSATESGGETEMFRRKQKQGEETDSEQAQKSSHISITPTVLTSVDLNTNAKSLKKGESESESDKGGSRISFATSGSSKNEAELERTGKKIKEEEIDSDSESTTSSSVSTSTTSSSKGASSKGDSSKGGSSIKGGSAISKGSKVSSKSSSTRSSVTSSATSQTGDSSDSSTDSSDTDTSESDTDTSDSSSQTSGTSGSGGSESSDSGLIPKTIPPKQQPQQTTITKPDTLDMSEIKIQEKGDLIPRKKTPTEPEEEPDNFWVRLGKRTDRVFFDDLFIPIIGTLTITCLVVFSIVIDVRLSGHMNIKYGYSFIPLMFAFLMWACLFFVGALSRVRYASNILRVPSGEFFERRWLNKEGARMGVLIFSSLALTMAFIFLVITSVKVDGGKWPTSWRNPFIPIWIMLGFIFIALLFSWRLMHGFLNFMFHLLVTGGVTALAICVYLKIQGHLSASATWAKVLVPLWVLNIFMLIVLIWHVFARTVFFSMTHPTSAFRKHNKKKKRDVSMQDRAASVPLGVAGVFLFLFEVVIVAYTEGVFKGKFKVPWSFVWIWFWLACFFALIWVFTYQNGYIPQEDEDEKVDKKKSRKNEA